MKWEADLSSKRSQEVLQENQRLIITAKDTEARLAQLEKVSGSFGRLVLAQKTFLKGIN